jgi:hypothetical protein
MGECLGIVIYYFLLVHREKYSAFSDISYMYSSVDGCANRKIFIVAWSHEYHESTKREEGILPGWLFDVQDFASRVHDSVPVFRKCIDPEAPLVTPRFIQGPDPR